MIEPNLTKPPRLPTEADVSTKLEFLAKTDEQHASFKQRVEGLKKSEKIVLANAFLTHSKGVSAALAKEKAYASSYNRLMCITAR